MFIYRCMEKCRSGPAYPLISSCGWRTSSLQSLLTAFQRHSLAALAFMRYWNNHGVLVLYLLSANSAGAAPILINHVADFEDQLFFLVKQHCI